MKTCYTIIITVGICILGLLHVEAAENDGTLRLGIHGAVRSTIYDRRLTYYSASLKAEYAKGPVVLGIEPYMKMDYPLYDMQGSVTRSSLGGVDLSADIKAAEWMSTGAWLGGARGDHDLQSAEGGLWGSLFLLDTLYLQATHDMGSSGYSIYQGYDMESSYRYASLYAEIYINSDMAIGAEIMDIQQQVESGGYDTSYQTRDYRGGPVIYIGSTAVLDVMAVAGEQKESGSYTGAAASLWFEPSRWFNMFVSTEYNIFISDRDTGPYSGISFNGGLSVYFL